VSDIAARIERAINADREYFDKCLAMRNPGPDAMGSVFTDPQTVQSVIAAAQKAQPAQDPNIKAPAVGFILDIKGTLGIIPLDSLDDDSIIKLRDPKSTGKVEATMMQTERQRECDYTTILLGPNDESIEQVWTLFPGPSILPSEVDAEGRDGKIITVAEARALGLHSVKVT